LVGLLWILEAEGCEGVSVARLSRRVGVFRGFLDGRERAAWTGQVNAARIRVKPSAIWVAHAQVSSILRCRRLPVWTRRAATCRTR